MKVMRKTVLLLKYKGLINTQKVVYVTSCKKIFLREVYRVK